MFRKHLIKHFNALWNVVRERKIQQEARWIHGATTLRNEVADKSEDVADASAERAGCAGLVAMVVGGCSGVGLATAAELLLQGAQRVVVAGKEPAAGAAALQSLQQQLPAERASCAEFLSLDVTDLPHFEEAFRTTLLRHGRLDLLFNVAAMMDDSRWEQEVDANICGLVRGALLAFRYMGPGAWALPPLAGLRGRGAGRGAGRGDGAGPALVNVASVAGLEPLVGAPVYSLTQSAAAALARAFGAEFHLSRTGVRVLSLFAGATRDEGAEAEAGDEEDALARRLLCADWATDARHQMQQRPVQRAGAVARAAAWVAGRGASGSVWLVEGGRLSQVRAPPLSRLCRPAAAVFH